MWLTWNTPSISDPVDLSVRSEECFNILPFLSLFGKLTAGVDPKSLNRHQAGHTSDDVAGLPLAGGFTTLQSLANIPKTWPLTRLTVPLSGFSKHLERLLEGFCLEVYATNADSDQQLGSTETFAKDLVLVLAFHLAERIASLLRQVLNHPTKVLYDPKNEVLFLPQFWLFPIYRELLNTASRNRPSKDTEVRRAASGLFFARSCLGKVPGRALFSQLSKRATACTIRMQIVKQINKKTN